MSDRWKERLRWTAVAFILLGHNLFVGWFYLWGTLIPEALEWLKLHWLTVIEVFAGLCLLYRLLWSRLKLLLPRIKPFRSKLWRAQGWFRRKKEDVRLKLIEIVVVILIGLAGVGIVWWQIAAAAKNAKEGSEATLFSGAVAQLSVGEDEDPPLAARVGALATLHNLMESDPEKYYWDVLKVTAVYIRQNSVETCRGAEEPPRLCPSPREDVSRALSILRDHRNHRDKAPDRGKNIFDQGKNIFDRAELLNLRQAHLKLANLHRVDLQGASLVGADLRDTFLFGADLRDANLRGADLQGASLVGADLRDANLRDAALYRAILSSTVLERASGLTKERLKQAYVNNKTTFPGGEKRDCDQLFKEGWLIHEVDDTCPKEKLGENEDGRPMFWRTDPAAN